MSRRIVIIAGEKSGDRLGAGLIRAARSLCPDLEFGGIAGPAMRDAGCESWYDASELAVMGLVEPLAHLPRLWRITRDLESRLLSDPPDVLVGIDSPDFNLRIERRLKRAGVPTVHYVSPSVWAWRHSRVKVLRASCDQVLCLFPFEKSYLERHGVPAEFIGHPLADDIPRQADVTAARNRLLPDSGSRPGPVIALMPGSRLGEVSRLGPVFAQTADWLQERIPEARFLAPMATPAVRAKFEQALRQYAPGCAINLFDGRAHEVMAAADLVLLASGTASLEAMLLKRPMVVAYRFSSATYLLARMLRLYALEHFSLPNLLAGEALVPEYLQAEVTPDRLGTEIVALLSPAEESRDHRRYLQDRFDEIHASLRQSADERAARAVLKTAGIG